MIFGLPVNESGWIGSSFQGASTVPICRLLANVQICPGLMKSLKHSPGPSGLEKVLFELWWEVAFEDWWTEMQKVALQSPCHSYWYRGTRFAKGRCWQWSPAGRTTEVFSRANTEQGCKAEGRFIEGSSFWLWRYLWGYLSSATEGVQSLLVQGHPC